MIEPEPHEGIDLESLVREHLERESETVDPRPLFERIQSSLARATPENTRPTARPRLMRFPWRWGGIAAAASLLILALSMLLNERTALAKADVVVREARQTHRQPIDRCYLVQVERESSLAAEMAPTTPQVRLTRLWTRGDRFWVESVRPDQRWAWGRDEESRFWIAFGPKTAVRMDSDEVPYWLNLYCDLYSLRVEQLLDNLLRWFDVTRETAPGGGDTSTIHVRATTRRLPADRPAIQTAELEIDAETRVVRRMVLKRVWQGQAFATVTYTLAETDALDPTVYQLEGHLAKGARVFTRDHEPERRLELLARWFGPQAEKWFRNSDSSH
jgi:hypothetical protein